MIHGANGYTGRLVAHTAKEKDPTPILAGRTGASVAALGRELNLPWRGS
jgi:short subunit dehydrogenase-like uncharacterized protein